MQSLGTFVGLFSKNSGREGGDFNEWGNAVSIAMFYFRLKQWFFVREMFNSWLSY